MVPALTPKRFFSTDSFPYEREGITPFFLVLLVLPKLHKQKPTSLGGRFLSEDLCLLVRL